MSDKDAEEAAAVTVCLTIALQEPSAAGATADADVPFEKSK